ncbi:zinc-dependent alcohol dehydrogenase [Pseudonocardia acidicola]|uniref:Alcohol dehydrogenase catalytic domain-containing protein n=1 Tax=Pseudonocardia acidicola TaxID=2724939 RepID=A0ABX1SA72_9PSEU|nr:zinc-binding dehydrogenase [Pseudonocardia acidicola]NMH97368.1 alcohol dehydrogenase catalytic domain-containing protein [Pseudonocardia acidicola]
MPRSAGKAVAAVAVTPGRTELDEFDLPDIGPDDALMMIEATGLCGTDLYFYHQAPDMVRFPLILGHEPVGRVARIGDRASRRWGVREGDRIVVEEVFPCSRCRRCRYLNYHLCENGGRYGAVATTVEPALWGGFSEYMYLHPDSLVYRVSDDVPADLGPLFIPIANGIRWVQQVGGLGIGDTVVVQGPGPHGLGCVIAAREAGAGTIVVTGTARDAPRLAVARELGADVVVDVDAEDPVARVAEITGGRLADLVVDVTAGAPDAFGAALRLAGFGGTVVVAGARHRGCPDVAVDTIFLKELTVRGVYGRDSRAVRPAIALIESGRYPLHRLVTHSFALEDTAAALDAFARSDPRTDAVHVCVRP